MTYENRRVLGTRSCGKEILSLLPSGPVVIDCQHVEVISPTVFHELLLKRDDLTFEGMNEDVQESLKLVEERLGKN